MTLERVSVILADDHSLFRDGLSALLSKDQSIAVIGQASDGDQTVELVAALHPRILLLDVEMPGGSVRATLSRVLRVSPTTRVIILTMHKDAVLRRQLLAAGASQYLTKTIPGDQLAQSIHAVAADDALPSTAPSLEGSAPPSLLTDRERIVLLLMSQALSNRAIAERLSITVGTVKRHATSIYRKLEAHSRMDAIGRATRLGLLE